MRRELQQKVAEWVKCIEKIRSVPSRGTQHVPGITGYVGEKLNVDLVGPLPTTPDGYRYVLTMQDNFSRHVSAVLLKTKEAVEVARKLIDHYIAVYGCPLQIYSDNGTEFKNTVWAEVIKKPRVKQTFTPPYNPSSNQVERFHRVLNNMLRIYGQKNDHAWIQCIFAACLAYNTKRNNATGVTPFTAMFGREAKLLVDLIVGLPSTESRTIPEHIRQLWDNYERMYAHMRKNDQVVIKRNAHQYQGGEYKEITEGGLVWYYCPKQVPGKPTKLTSI